MHHINFWFNGTFGFGRDTCTFEEFQDECHGNHLGYQNGTDSESHVAILFFQITSFPEPYHGWIILNLDDQLPCLISKLNDLPYSEF